MTDLFIPPSGAMQFHVTWNPHDEKEVDFIVWIEGASLSEAPGTIDRPRCSCRECWVVIQDSLRGEPIKQGAQPSSYYRKTVCACSGRIIE